MSLWARDVVGRTRHALEPLADPVRAEPMAHYMKDHFAFLGIGTPDRRRAQCEAWRELAAPTEADLRAAALGLWELREREYHYAGSELVGRFIGRPGADFLLDPVARLITTNSWWDSVDSLRSSAVTPLVVAHPGLVTVMDDWLGADDIWLVRCAVLHQLGRKEATDVDRLFVGCLRRADHPDFFVRKAIGWALRDYAWTDPAAVRRFVAAHERELAPLSRREALLHIDRKRPRT